MKKIITKFWGVALIVVLLSSFFVAAAPVSAADPLVWNPKTDAPSNIPNVGTITTGAAVQDYAFSGATMLAATGTGLYLSTMGGALPADIIARPQAGTDNFTTANYVGIAPDDPNVMVVLDAISLTGAPPGNGDVASAYISVNGGATWTNMAIPTANNTLYRGVEISPLVTGGIRYIAVWGRIAATGNPALYYFNYGSGVGTWTDAAQTAAPWDDYVVGAGDEISAFAFSPNFASDYIGVAVSTDYAGGDDIELHILSFNSTAWDATVSAGYPVSITNPGGAITINGIDIALPPDYDGSDESLRIAFVGIASSLGANNGIFRVLDNIDPIAALYATTGIYTVAYDGTTLVGGAIGSNNVVRSSDPLSTNPTFLSARNLKRPAYDAGVDAINVQYDGETLYASSNGTSGAIAKSLDFGNTFNDFTMINAGVAPFVLGTIEDIYMATNGDPWYITVDDGTVTSVYRISMFAVQRVLTLATNANAYWLRGIPSDGGVVYVALNGGTTVYYTDNGGVSRWFQRNNIPAAIADLAVESAQTIYIANGVNVYKSTNAGFTWGTPVNSRISPGAIFGLVSLGENELFATGTLGALTFTRDGGVTWTATFAGLSGAGGNLRVAATGLDTGDFIYIGGAASNQIYRCSISPANFLYEFRSMNLATTATYATTGLKLISGVLYAVSTNTTHSLLNHTLMPTFPTDLTAPMWSTEVGPTAAAFNLETNSIEVSGSAMAPNDIYIYAASAAAVFVFQDNVALVGPALTGPADDTLIQIASPLTGVPQPVNFSWSKLSLATSYQVQIALDESFSQIVTTVAVASTADPVALIQAGGTFAPGQTYYWRVRVNLPVYSAWSETRSFTVQPTAASVPVISSPTIGQSIDNTSPAFSWSPVSGATMYRFELSEGISFADPIYAVDTPVAGAQLPADMQLERGTQYFWRVKALSPVESDFSTVGNFVVAEEETTAPPPAVTTTIITVPPPPAGTTTVVTIPPAVTEEVNPAYIWAIIIIGAVLVIAVIVLIVRTRRSV